MRKAYIGVAVVLAMMMVGSAMAEPVLLSVKAADGSAGPINALPGDVINIAVFCGPVADTTGQGWGGLAGFELVLDVTGPGSFMFKPKANMTLPPDMPTVVGTWFAAQSAPLGGIFESYTGQTGAGNRAGTMSMGGAIIGDGGSLAFFQVKVAEGARAGDVILVSLTEDSFLADPQPVAIESTFDAPLRINVVPEPATLTLLGVGLVGLLGIRRRK